MSNIKKNYIYSLIYQILTIMIPLITMPYISRVLGAEMVGVYSYTNSIVQYFILLSMLGILDYGNRTIAGAKSKFDRSLLFEEIYFIQFITSITAVGIYLIYICCVKPIYRSIAVLQIIALLASLLDINWFYFGIEKFKLTVTRNIIIKILSLIAILVFVRSREDLWIYTLITVGSLFTSNAILWLFLKNEIVVKAFDLKKALKHLKPCFILTLPLLSRSIFVYLDKTMLGIMADMSETGYYDFSEKIVLAATSILTSLGTVMLPRISNLLSNGSRELAQKYTSLSIDFVVFLGCAFTFGIWGVSDMLVIVFLGQEYESCNIVVDVMAFTIVLVGWTNVIRTQYILPNKKDKIYAMAVLLGAVGDFFVNLLLIPKYRAYGAAIGWIVAEIIITATQTYYAGKELPIKQYLYNCRGFLISAIVMGGIIKIYCNYVEYNLMHLLMAVGIGGVVYLALSYIYVRHSRFDLLKLLVKK